MIALFAAILVRGAFVGHLRGAPVPIAKPRVSAPIEGTWIVTWDGQPWASEFRVDGTLVETRDEVIYAGTWKYDAKKCELAVSENTNGHLPLVWTLKLDALLTGHAILQDGRKVEVSFGKPKATD